MNKSDNNALVWVYWFFWLFVIISVNADAKKCPNGDADCKIGERCAFEKSPAECVKQ